MKFKVALLLIVASCGNVSDNAYFDKGESLGLIDKLLPEASGIASSVVNSGYLWALNDGQNPSEVHLIDLKGNVKMTCRLKVKNRDWEEIAVGPGPEEGKTYVYVGEIGDNEAVFDFKYIYRFEEPKADTTVRDIVLADTLTIKMSDGKRDTETMMIARGPKTCT